MNQTPKKMSRRRMLKTVAAAVAAPAIITSGAHAKKWAPNEVMQMAAIGTGRMGHGDMKECLNQGLKANARTVAVCDLDRNRAEHAKAELEKMYTKEFGAGKFTEIKVYTDFREIMARSDIDGMTISTPEHWHALIGIAAANSGKSMYLQKPMTYSIAEGRALAKAVKKNKVTFQVGSQQRSSIYFRKTCELVRNGFIGNLQTIHVTNPTDKGVGKDVKMEVPENLNYQMWLGPTPDAPYTEDRVHPRSGYGRPGWLQIEQYCRGMITGWGAHMYDIAQWGNGTDTDSGPVEISAKGEFPDRGLFNVHTTYVGNAKYANGVKLTSGSVGGAGVKFTGDEGSIFVQRGSFKSDPAGILREKIPESGIHLYESKNHMLNFLECMRSGKETIAPVEVGHRSNTVCVLHHIAMKLGRPLKWDPKKERFKGDAEANTWLDYPHREPWTV